MRRLISITVIVLLLGLIGISLVQSPRVSARMAEFVIERRLKGWTAQVTIGQQQVGWNNAVVDQVKVVLFDPNQKEWEFFSRRIHVKWLKPLWNKHNEFVVAARNLTVANASWNSYGGYLSLFISKASGHPMRTQGNFSFQETSWKQAKASDVSGRLRGQGEELCAEHVAGGAFGGTFQGQGCLMLSTKVYHLTVHLTDASLDQMEDINKTVFNQVDGQLNGTVQLSGQGGRITSFNMAMTLPHGGAIRASLLSQIAQYIPGGVQKQQIEELLKTDSKVPVEVLSWQLSDVSANKLSGVFNMFSKKLNLRLDNSTIDINLDEDMTSLINIFNIKPE